MKQAPPTIGVRTTQSSELQSASSFDEASFPTKSRQQEQLLASNHGIDTIRANRSLFAYIYDRYKVPERLRGSDSINSLGILESVMYRETFGGGKFPEEDGQHFRNATKIGQSLASDLNGITRLMGIDLYDIVGKSNGPSLTRFNIKPRETMIPGVIACIQDPSLRKTLSEAYDTKLGYIPENHFGSIVVGNPQKELEVVAALMKAYEPMVDQLKELKANRSQPFSRNDEVAAYYELFYRGAKGFAIIHLQKDLVAAGFLKGDKVDGGFGKDTISALSSYRNERGHDLKPPITIPQQLRKPLIRNL